MSIVNITSHIPMRNKEQLNTCVALEHLLTSGVCLSERVAWCDVWAGKHPTLWDLGRCHARMPPFW